MTRGNRAVGTLAGVWAIVWCFGAVAGAAVWGEHAKLTPDDGMNDDYFGCSVSISGGTAIVGANEHDMPDESNAGAAYIYGGSGWPQVAKLSANDGLANDYFGCSVSISGNTAIVGAHEADIFGQNNAGAAYIFQDAGSGWTQAIKLQADAPEYDDHFGYSVAIRGNTAIVGAVIDDNDFGVYSGAAYIFQDTGSGWAQAGKISPDDGLSSDLFGFSVAISGNTAVIGAKEHDNAVTDSDSGAAYVFRDTGSGWTQVAKLLPDDAAEDDYFGCSVSISGDTVVVGAFGDDESGESSGAAYVFQDTGSAWEQVAKLLPGDGEEEACFGDVVSIDGCAVVIGAYGKDDNGTDSGAAYIFKRSGPDWVQVEKLQPDGNEEYDYFGWSVAVDGAAVVVGAVGDDNEQLSVYSGAAYVFGLIPGDANMDGVVNDQDASILAAHWQHSSEVTWCDGDFNGDGVVNDRDASILAAHWQESMPGGEQNAPVPEPTAAVLLAGILLSLALWRKRFAA